MTGRGNRTAPHAEVAARYQQLAGDSSCTDVARQLAAEFGVNRATVRSWIHRARKAGLLDPYSHPGATLTEKRVPIGPYSRNIAAAVQRIRTQRRMTYTELVQKLADIGHPIPILGIRRIERFERRIDVDDLVALAAVLEVDPWSMTAPPKCDSCKGAPPAGFRCLHCGSERA